VHDQPRTDTEVVTAEARQPSVIARRATSAISGPGVTVTTVAATMNARICPAISRR
jgi:hypothetical protein